MVDEQGLANLGENEYSNIPKEGVNSIQRASDFLWQVFSKQPINGYVFKQSAQDHEN